MKAKLTIDNSFTPCPESDGDEFYQNGMFVFNISKMIGYIQKNPEVFVPEEVAVKDLHKFLSLPAEKPMISMLNIGTAK